MKENYQTFRIGNTFKTKFKNTILGLSAVFCFNSVNAQSGAALNLDGTNDYVTVPSNTGLQVGAGNFTIEFWAKPTLVNGAFHYVVTKDNTNSDLEFLVGLGSNDRWFCYTKNSSNYVGGLGFATANTWAHVACTYDGANQNLYVNGVFQGSVAVGAIPKINTQSILIGGRTATAPQQFFAGDIDEVRIWNYARTSCQINSFMNCEISGSATGLVANYHFNQGVAGNTNTGITSISDASGNSNTGTLINSALAGASSNWVTPGGVVSGFTTPAPLPTIAVNSGTISAGSSFTMVPSGGVTYTYTPSGPVVTPATTSSYTVSGTASTGCTNTAVSTVAVQAAALNMDGVNDYVVVPSNTGLQVGAGNFTIEFWAKPTLVNGAFHYVVTKDNTNSDLEFLVGLGSNDRWFCYTKNSSNYVGSLGFATANTWYHVACTYDGANQNLYVNGVFQGSVAVGAIPKINTQSILIGGRTATAPQQFFAGDIDEVRIWNYARTACQINTFKNCEIPSSSAGLVANYHFNQGAVGASNSGVTTLLDASGNSNNGTLTNFALTGASSNWVAPGGVVTGSITPAVLTPTVGSTVSNSVICRGNSTTLNGTGANTYVWTGGVTNGTAFSPTTTITYTVTGTSTVSGCSNTAVNTVTVNSLPTVSVTSGSICAGSSYTMVASGATSYTYSSGSNVVSPSTNTSYTVIGSNSNGCANTAVSNVTVNSIFTPTVSIAEFMPLNVATGGTATASDTYGPNSAAAAFDGDIVTNGWGSTSATGASWLEYNFGAGNGKVLTAYAFYNSPSMVGGWSSTGYCPTDWTFEGYNGTTWDILDTKIGAPNQQNVWYNYNIANTTSYERYRIHITNPTNYKMITELKLISGRSFNACDNNLFVASNSAAVNPVTYQWQVNGANVGTNNDSLDLAVIYKNDIITCNINTSAACTNTNAASSNSIVLAMGIVTNTASATICAGQAITVGTSTYTAAGTYNNTFISSMGCDSILTTNLIVNNLPVVLATTNNTLLCVGETATLSVSGAATYTWSTAENTTDVVVSPTVTTTYTVDGTDANGCSNTTTIMQDVSLCTGIVTLSNSNLAINVYPNPNNGLFVVEFTTVSKVTVTNALGQVVIAETFEAGKHALDIQNQSTGIYFVKVIQDGKQHVIKLIKE